MSARFAYGLTQNFAYDPPIINGKSMIWQWFASNVASGLVYDLLMVCQWFGNGFPLDSLSLPSPRTEKSNDPPHS